MSKELVAVQCERCGAFMVPRSASRLTPEQEWCGSWWDHPVIPGRTDTFGHTDSVLIPSPALRAMS